MPKQVTNELLLPFSKNGLAFPNLQWIYAEFIYKNSNFQSPVSLLLYFSMSENKTTNNNLIKIDLFYSMSDIIFRALSMALVCFVQMNSLYVHI